MLKKIIWLLVAFPAAVLVVTLAVANRHIVRLVLDPFEPQAPIIFLELPFFAYLFAALIAGIVLGGVATWMSQSKWRRMAREHLQESLRWKAEADRLARERDAGVAAPAVPAGAARLSHSR